MSNNEMYQYEELINFVIFPDSAVGGGIGALAYRKNRAAGGFVGALLGGFLGYQLRRFLWHRYYYKLPLHEHKLVSRGNSPTIIERSVV
ncbi:unnamed protein product [marine sediment metagenome]|uniref:Uncharacterized protein n=1 Tax=marine sediment metagenome TaxID=412755 RepID=X1MK42_9ZZZZ